MGQTVDALLQRGIDQASAETLVRSKFTLAKLVSLTPAARDALPISEASKNALGHLDRQPIQTEVLTKLLYECSRICCICKERGKSIIVHHISPWGDSSSNAAENLVVLCLECHGEAHTTRELGRNLTSDELVAAKAQWIADVRTQATKAILSNAPNNMLDAVWDYFNHNRLIEVAEASGLIVGPFARNSLANRSTQKPYLYAGQMRTQDDGYYLFADLVRRVCRHHKVVDLNTIWSAAKMRAILSPNNLVALTSRFHYRTADKSHRDGPGQQRTAYMKRAGIRIEFAFDAWECTTTSSWSFHLRGTNKVTVIFLLRGIEKRDAITHLQVTCLAIGTGFDANRVSRTPDIAYQREAEE